MNDEQKAVKKSVSFDLETLEILHQVMARHGCGLSQAVRTVIRQWKDSRYIAAMYDAGIVGRLSED